MGIHLYLLSANPPTFVIVSHDLTDLYYQPLYSAKLHILKILYIWNVYLMKIRKTAFCTYLYNVL